MATYEQVRKEHLLRSNSRQARFFATKRYDPNKETILMLPGGLASQLERSNTSFNSNPQDFEKYENIWIDLGTIFKKEAEKLEMDENLRDKDDHIVIPNGPLESFVQTHMTKQNDILGTITTTTSRGVLTGEGLLKSLLICLRTF